MAVSFLGPSGGRIFGGRVGPRFCPPIDAALRSHFWGRLAVPFLGHCLEAFLLHLSRRGFSQIDEWRAARPTAVLIDAAEIGLGSNFLKRAALLPEHVNQKTRSLLTPPFRWRCVVAWLICSPTSANYPEVQPALPICPVWKQSSLRQGRFAKRTGHLATLLSMSSQRIQCGLPTLP